MSTRALMVLGSVVFGALGLASTFVPDAVLRALGDASPAARAWAGAPALQVLVQLLGAAYLGFAMLDWMAQQNLIGGIYSRPVAVGNLLYFTAAGLALVKALPAFDAPAWLWAVAAVHLALAVAFGVVMFRHPIRRAE